jgi:5-formyltetrahydrofolate cyclo-ligase
LTSASTAIAGGIADWLQVHSKIRKLGVYAALAGEPDLTSLHCLAREIKLLYPLVHPDQRLEFHLVEDPATLARGQFGIMEPLPRIHPVVPVEDMDAFLCPGLAFDASGTRLGRGGGFYDRALASARPEAGRVGVCFSIQMAEALPRESHDIAMGHLATEHGVCVANVVRPTDCTRPNPAGSS